MITGDIDTLEDGMRAVAGMMRTHHECDGRGEWLTIADRLEQVAAEQDPCPRVRDDAVRAMLAFLADRPPVEVPA